MDREAQNFWGRKGFLNHQQYNFKQSSPRKETSHLEKWGKETYNKVTLGSSGA